MKRIPEWLEQMDDEDLQFIRRFITASGSLKKIASDYDVSYPTVRLRLDRLIERIEAGDVLDEDPYIKSIKNLALKGKIDYNTAKELIEEYRKRLGELENE